MNFQDRLGTCIKKRPRVSLGAGNAAALHGNADDDHRFDSTVHPLEFAAVIYIKRRFILQMIILPRQAGDKHREEHFKKRDSSFSYRR